MIQRSDLATKADFLNPTKNSPPMKNESSVLETMNDNLFYFSTMSYYFVICILQHVLQQFSALFKSVICENGSIQYSSSKKNFRTKKIRRAPYRLHTDGLNEDIHYRNELRKRDTNTCLWVHRQCKIMIFKILTHCLFEKRREIQFYRVNFVSVFRKLQIFIE